MSKQMSTFYEVDPWKVIEKQFDINQNEISESIFSIANEYFGTRGLFEEGMAPYKDNGK